jgi:molybdopterin-guanine dinucleotide biosynthesis protein A
LIELQNKAKWQKIITPFILSGGRSQRMGANKSFVRLGGQPLIEIVLKKVVDIFDKTPIIITNQFADYKYLGCDMVGDIIKDKGPLGGIHTGLIRSATPYIFVFACDMPFIDKTLVHYMLNRLGQEDILIPHNGESVEPLHAIYSKQCLPAIEAHLHKDRRCVQSFFDDVNIAYIDQEEMNRLSLLDCYFLNVNTVEDLNKAEHYLRSLNL